MWNILHRLFGKANSANSAPSGSTPSGKIVAAKVIKIEKHPNADRLQILALDMGGGQTVEPVVCGAFNFREGDIVALALPGARIARNIHSSQHEPFTLEKAAIRGVESQGMICAGFELGLSEQIGDNPEIMVLPPGTQLGKIIA